MNSWAKRIKLDAIMLWFARNHPDTPLFAKALCFLAVAYALSSHWNNGSRYRLNCKRCCVIASVSGITHCNRKVSLSDKSVMPAPIVVLAIRGKLPSRHM